MDLNTLWYTAAAIEWNGRYSIIDSKHMSQWHLNKKGGDSQVFLHVAHTIASHVFSKVRSAQPSSHLIPTETRPCRRKALPIDEVRAAIISHIHIPRSPIHPLILAFWTIKAAQYMIAVKDCAKRCSETEEQRLTHPTKQCRRRRIEPYTGSHWRARKL